MPALKNIATRLRIDSMRATTASASGHPTTCFSAADIVAALFFAEMRYDPQNPQHPLADRFVLSKGHAAPMLYAAWAEAGYIPRDELLKLREFTSDLEGHPTPRLPFVDVATGSLGQGLAPASASRSTRARIGSDYRTYVLMGDGETAEGSVWEAAAMAEFYKLDSLCAIVDVNALGQSRATQLGHDMEAHRRRWAGFGWHTIVIDGHDLAQILDALDGGAAHQGAADGDPGAHAKRARACRSSKGAPNWHGKALKKGDELDRAMKELEAQLVPEPPRARPQIQPPAGTPRPERDRRGAAAVLQARRHCGDARGVRRRPRPTRHRRFTRRRARRRREELDVQREVRSRAPRSLLSVLHRRAGDDRRLDGPGRARRDSVSVDVCRVSDPRGGLRPHARDQRSQREDGRLARRRVDRRRRPVADGARRSVDDDVAAEHHGAVSVRRRRAEHLVVNAARHHGPVYIRTTRPKLPVIYDNDETFPIGGCKVVRRSDSDVATVIGAGVTLFEALKAHDELATQGIDIRVIDLYSLQPIDARR